MATKDAAATWLETAIRFIRADRGRDVQLAKIGLIVRIIILLFTFILSVLNNITASIKH